ncbi:MAG TPA: DNA integrity scanning diadenylate cyclase DisA [Limnochordia bacterium]
MRDERDENLIKTLRLLSPGAALYEGLENILRARSGALIVVGDSPDVLALVNGGFKIDAEANPSALYELAKMDGAIVLSSDARRILYVNAQLMPNPMIPTVETGTRHRTAERVARQTGSLVIAISQRRNVITIYRGTLRHVLRDVGVVLAKANQALATLERYKKVLEQALTNLTALEFEDLVTLHDVTTCIQRAQMVERIAQEIRRYIAELGTEGRLVQMQLDELMVDIRDEGRLVIKDYFAPGEDGAADALWNEMMTWSSEDLLDLSLIARSLGHGGPIASLDVPITPRGHRVLHKIPRLPEQVVENLVRVFTTLPEILNASIDELDDVEGIGEVRARNISEGLRRLREQALLDRHL